MDSGDNAHEGSKEVCEAIADLKDAWQGHEEQAMIEMATLAKRTRRQQDTQIDVASRIGRDAAHKLLRSVDSATSKLQIQLASQTYRESITESVVKPWTEPGGRYGIRVLVVSVQHRRDISVNNQLFCLSEEAQHLSLELCRSWAAIGSLLREVRKQGLSVIPRSRAVGVLKAFDSAWAVFEHKFLLELEVMRAEAKHPLAPLVQATRLVCGLERIHQRFDLPAQLQEMVDDIEYQEQHRLLVDTVSRLNLAANPKTRGFSFTVQTLNELEAVLEEYEMEQPGAHEHSRSPSFALAEDAVDAFNSLCGYFYQVKDCMDEVDPNLRNNKGLVERLARWEASWGRALDHVLDPLGRQALETLMASIQKAQARSPEFVEMCQECSADMFLALPRLMWLSFLESPADLSPEVQCLLRHRFVELRGADGELGCYPGDELEQLLGQYRSTIDVIASAVASKALDNFTLEAGAPAAGLDEAKRDLAVQLMCRSAVLGRGGELGEPATILMPGPEGVKAQEACQAFVCGLESWSIELQRHCATDWNAFVAVVVRCLSTDVMVATTEASTTVQALQI